MPERISKLVYEASSKRITIGQRPTAYDDPAKVAADVSLVPGTEDCRPITVVYVHGIGNQTRASQLKAEWDLALFDVEMGQRTRMAYWVNRNRYPVPEPPIRGPQPQPRSEADPLAAEASNGVDGATNAEIEALASNPNAKAFLQSLAARMRRASFLQSAAAGQGFVEPQQTRQANDQWLTRLLLRDVHDYLLVPDLQARIDAALRQRLKHGRRFVIIAHSIGAVIAHHVLSQWSANADLAVDLLVTIGSPLGFPEIQTQLNRGVGADSLHRPLCVKRWVNVVDVRDPVATDIRISPADSATVNARLTAPHREQNPHAVTGYLESLSVRRAIRETLGAQFVQEVSRFTVARDVADAVEDMMPNAEASAPPMHEVLVEIRSGEGEETEREIAAALGGSLPKGTMRLSRYLALLLTSEQIEKLGVVLQKRDRNLARIWRDTERRALLRQSGVVIQAWPAQQSYGADGRDIAWAVLDTGIARDHPHFRDRIREVHDCTGRRGVVPGSALTGDGVDNNGHGTHVAGIIAGRGTPTTDSEPPISGIAPLANLCIYKVLDDNGRGNDSAIINALEHISQVNADGNQLVIHGVNLSLGGAFDPKVYGCGHSPICQELRRLWRQGVIVVLAAGNQGYAELQSAGAGGGVTRANLDISIGDPANLEDAIAVGSVHKQRPTVYGPSYFSSRGPTADGRVKPDLVAPGERIVSAAHDSNQYVEMSGTSMAAPHVSGLLAAFLSVRREYIGEPDRVKRLLLRNCTDLKRDRYVQGARNT